MSGLKAPAPPIPGQGLPVGFCVRPRVRVATLGRLREVAALLKIRVNLLVAFTVFAGAVLAGRSQPEGSGEGGPLALIPAVLGAFLVACAASTWNQITECGHDRAMGRTANRPLVRGTVSLRFARGVSGVLLGLGFLVLLGGAGWFPALIALCTLLIYGGAYTPLKRVTSLSLLVGAVAGALPPLIGWTAVRPDLGGGAAALFAILFLWQVPHFLAIGWLYRDEYRRAGFQLLPSLDPSGRATAVHAVVYALALVPVSLLPSVFGLASAAYFTCALLLSLAHLAVTAGFALRRTDAWARVLLRGSILYLSGLFACLLALP